MYELDAPTRDVADRPMDVADRPDPNSDPIALTPTSHSIAHGHSPVGTHEKMLGFGASMKRPLTPRLERKRASIFPVSEL